MNFFQESQFMPHGYCLRWNSALLFTFITGNLLVACAYFSIPTALLLFVKKRKDLAFSWMFVLFGIFIVSCGLTHLIKIWTFYEPVYWLEAIMDLFTGIISMITAILLWPLLPKALGLPSPRLLAEKNQLLESSIAETAALNKELQELNEKLQFTRDAAIEASNAKSAFVAAISHELRTPLTAILGMNELLISSNITEQQAQLSHNIQVSALSLLETVNDLLDLSRLEAGKLEIEKLPFLLKNLAFDCLKTVESQASRKSLDLKLSIDNDLPHCLRGDAARIKQIITNLLSNAVKFTDKGFVELGVQLLSRNDSSFSLRFTVADTGVGIAENDREKIFQPFTQADQSTARRYGGTGLGLSIAQYLANLMCSRICLESTLGNGSKFWFDIHLEEGGSAESFQKISNQYRVTFRKAKVLVVDDDPFLQKLAGLQLERLGLFAVTAGSAREVLQLIKSGYNFDLVLMDCHMPEQDGYSLTREIREVYELRTLPIIAVTAGAMKGDKERCLQSGMNDYLSKPYTLRDLAAKLQKWLPGQTTEESDSGPEASSQQTSRPDLVDLPKLKQIYGDAACREILQTFFQSAEPIIKQLSKARELEDSELVKFLAHKLKGASSMTCIASMTKLSKQIENHAYQENWDAIDREILELQKLFIDVRNSSKVV